MFDDMMPRRGDVFELKPEKTSKGHEQCGRRYAVVLQADDFPLSTVIVAPTSTSRKASFIRPEIEVKGKLTRVLVEHIHGVDREQRLGSKVGHLHHHEMEQISKACKILLDL